MTKSADVVVVGGGIIGVAVAYELSKRSLGVIVLERNTLASCATYASAGMLAPAEFVSDGLSRKPVMDLGFESFAMWPTFVEEIESASGFSTDCRPLGILRVAADEEEEAVVKQQSSWAEERGLDLSWLSAKEALQLEPALNPEICGATFSTTEHNVTPTRVVEALRRAAGNNGAEFREHTTVSTLVRTNGRVTGVRIPSEDIYADKVVLAVGSWGCEAGRWLGMEVPVHPVRGQAAYLNELDKPLRHVVLKGGACAIPKSDGTTWIGTTREHDAGYRQETTVAGIASVFTRIIDLLPGVGEASVHHTRAGLRPWCADDLPVLGPSPGAENVIFATGHYGEGILLAPVTAGMVADVITNDLSDLGPFAAGRFAIGGR